MDDSEPINSRGRDHHYNFRPASFMRRPRWFFRAVRRMFEEVAIMNDGIPTSKIPLANAQREHSSLIVERLRKRNVPYGWLELADKAADEIELLSKQLQDMKVQMVSLAGVIHRFKD